MNQNSARALLPLSLLACGLALAGATRGPAAAPPAAPPAGGGTITVDGRGSVTVDPTRLALRASVEAQDEIAADAVRTFQAARERVVEGFAAAGIAGLEVRGTGARLTYGPQQEEHNMFGNVVVMGVGGTQEPPAAGARFEEQFVLSLTGADALDDGQKAEALAGLLDTAIDLGMRPASSGGAQQSVVWFAGSQGATSEGPALLTCSLGEEARAAAEERAYAAAMADARRRATALARLAGRALGQVSSIQVLRTSGSWNQASAASTLSAELTVVFELD
jgi:uncharacterized protein YggE